MQPSIYALGIFYVTSLHNPANLSDDSTTADCVRCWVTRINDIHDFSIVAFIGASPILLESALSIYMYVCVRHSVNAPCCNSPDGFNFAQLRLSKRKEKEHDVMQRLKNRERLG